MTRQYGLIGVPSSAGAHTPGIEKAPLALRNAGIVEKLRVAGCRIADYGDLPRVRYAPDKARPTAQGLDRVVSVAVGLASQIDGIISAGDIPLVLGGDCSITVCAVAGMLRHHPDLVLLYMDGGVDLETPETNIEGNLDSMGVAHMIGEDGSTTAFSRIGPRYPLLSPDDVIFFGIEHMSLDDGEEQVMLKHKMRYYDVEKVRSDPEAAALDVVAEIEAQRRPFLVHFDVDVIEFVDFPMSNVPHYKNALTFAEAMQCVTIFAGSPQFAGLVITEINPDHMDEEGEGLRIFVDAISEALAPS